MASMILSRVERRRAAIAQKQRRRADVDAARIAAERNQQHIPPNEGTDERERI